MIARYADVSYTETMDLFYWLSLFCSGLTFNGELVGPLRSN